MSAEFRSVAVDRIDPSPFNPRKRFTGLEGLGASIQANGLVEPLLVRPVGERLELVAGERRWRAAKLVGVAELPCLVRAIGDREALELAVLENVQRESMEALEEAEGFGRLLEQGYTVELLAERVGCSKSQIYNRLALRKLSAKVAVAVGQGFVEASVAQRLVKLSHEDQDEALKRLVAEDGKPLVVKRAVKILKDYEAELAAALEKQRASLVKASKTRAANRKAEDRDRNAKLAEAQARGKRQKDVFLGLMRPLIVAEPARALAAVEWAQTWNNHLRKRQPGELLELSQAELIESLLTRAVTTYWGDELRDGMGERICEFLGLDWAAALQAGEPVPAVVPKSAKPAKAPKSTKASPPAKRKGGRK